jgi:non-ribosomal peptide synthetase-like protein
MGEPRPPAVDALPEVVIDVIDGPFAGKRIVWDSDELILGRKVLGPGFLGEDRWLSRRHAALHRAQDGGCVATDLGSSYGTFVNGDRITEPTRLNPGDALRAGRTLMRLVESKKPTEWRDAETVFTRLDPFHPGRLPAAKVGREPRDHESDGDPTLNVVLDILAGPLSGNRILWDSTELVIGRKAQGAGMLGWDPELSRWHAALRRTADGHHTVRDLGSTNGTFVNGLRIDGTTRLYPGDELSLGSSRLRLVGVEHRVVHQTVRLPVLKTRKAPARPVPARARAYPSQVELLAQYFEQTCDRSPHAVALVCGTTALTYAELDRRANALAHLLLARGIQPSDPVGILLERSVDIYVALLGVLKAGAAYVPFDPSFPADRVAYIADDAGMKDMITTTAFNPQTAGLTCATIELDVLRDLAGQPQNRPRIGVAPESLAYIIYTSGSTGKPKGVALSHANIVNFLRVATPIYDVHDDDRVYQGLSIAFDYSIEEIWPAWIAGATLVAGPGDYSQRVGQELAEFLNKHEITVFCCVPTLLTTLEDEIPSMRFLMVSGEACPPDLVRRWSRQGVRMLNTYGPTETTVTATCGELYPDRPVTLGRPLPTYSVYILDENLNPVAQGESGELCIGGPGVAIGYLNHPELTAEKFVLNPFAADRAHSPRLYRSGDLTRFTAGGEIEYLGRIDTQVKIRGYRIELGEIEEVLRADPAVENAVVTPLERDGVAQDLIGYLTLRDRDSPLDEDELRERLHASLKARLPAYMVPSFVEILDAFPMLAADKINRNALPTPTSLPLGVRSGPHVAADNPLEQKLAAAWGEVMGIATVSVEDDFFGDLGANSMLMAQFCSRVRKDAELPPVSMKEVYLNPTVRKLAAVLADSASTPAAGVAPAYRRASNTAFIMCGVAQFSCFLASTYLAASVGVFGFEWLLDATGLIDLYLRSLVVGGASFLVLSTAPILAKWLLVGRWKPREIPVWSLGYLRFWFVKTLILASPLRLLVGSPLYVLYLRALGAKIGPGTVILSPIMPVCTDLLTIGAGTVIGNDSSFTCYRAYAGRIQTGPVSIGSDVLVGGTTLLDVFTSMGDGTQLGHASALRTGQAVPDGEHWHGSPAVATEVDYQSVPAAKCGTSRRFAFGATQLLTAVLSTSLLIAIAMTAVTEVPFFVRLLHSEPTAFGGARFYLDALFLSIAWFFGSIVVRLVFMVTVPRLLNLAVTPDRVYRLYGFHYWAQSAITRTTNSPFFFELFGDSSYVVGYLRALGYDLGEVIQTGSNFGAKQKHDTPYLTSVGAGSLISDGLSIVNTDFSSTSFRVSAVSLGARSFFGNMIAYPSQAKVGDNCLLATKVMVPIDGEIRENVGLLGSPPFEIPRSVQRDSLFKEQRTGDEADRRLAAKNKHNTVTISLYLLMRWFHTFAVTLLSLFALALYGDFGAAAFAAATVLGAVFSVVYFVLIERAANGIRGLKPQFCSIHDPRFWRQERLWKLGAPRRYNGTPFKNVLWRMVGVRIGKRVFDDGCMMPEKTLATVGDDCTLAHGSRLQCHSLEDGTFKSDYTALGNGCTLGPWAFVAYGVTMGEGSVLEADAFLTKGTETEPYTRWGGNPAMEIR